MVCARLAAAMLLVGAVALPSRTTAQGAQADSLRQNRADLEQQVRERMGQITKDRLGATDEQMAKLQATNQKYDDMRRVLVDQEKSIRLSLRQEMQQQDPARQKEVGGLLDQLIKTQQQRVEIQQQEQKELAGYLTPLQRARYFALEQQIRQRVTQLRQAQNGRAGRGGRAQAVRPPGGGRGVQPKRPPK